MDPLSARGARTDPANECGVVRTARRGWLLQAFDPRSGGAVVPAAHRAHLGHQAVRRRIQPIEPGHDHRHVVLQSGHIVDEPLQLPSDEGQVNFWHDLTPDERVRA